MHLIYHTLTHHLHAFTSHEEEVEPLKLRISRHLSIPLSLLSTRKAIPGLILTWP